MASVASLFCIVIGVTPLGQTGSDGCRPFHSIVKSIQKISKGQSFGVGAAEIAHFCGIFGMWMHGALPRHPSGLEAGRPQPRPL